MNEILEKQLVEKYPRLLRYYKTKREDGMYGGVYFGIQTEDGWYDLIDQALSYANSNISEDSIAYVFQIKEKFGALRIYIIDAPKTFDYTVLDRLERESLSVCEKCGSIEGVNLTTTNPQGGVGDLQTLCTDCRDNNGRVKCEIASQIWGELS